MHDRYSETVVSHKLGYRYRNEAAEKRNKVPILRRIE